MKQGSMGFEELVKENLFNVSLATRYRYLKRLEKEGLIRIGPDPENPNTKRVVPNVDVVKSVSLRIPDE
jgi:transposase